MTETDNIKTIKVEVDIKLTDYQREILECPQRYTIVEAATKTGKTFSHLYWLFEKAHEEHVEAGYNFWWVAPVFFQASIAFHRLRRKVESYPEYRVNLSKLMIETPLGSIIHFKSANDPDALYGEDVYACVFDEFTRAKAEAWYALRSTLTATKAPCKFIGNYKGASNWGHLLAEKAQTDPDSYRYFKITAWDAVRAGILDEEEILQAQKDLPSFMFKALYLAEGDIDKARLIEDEAISDLVTNDHVSGGHKYLTCDIALHGSDKFVIWVWDGFRAIDMIPIEKCDSKEAEEQIRTVANKYRVRRSNITYDADGLGTFLKGYLKGAIPFHNGAPPVKFRGMRESYRNLKSQCYFRAAKRINDGEYFIDCDVEQYWAEIREEFECVKNRSYESSDKLEVLRKSEIKEVIGRSPDFSDAFVMREIFQLKRKRTVGAVFQE